MSWASLSTAFLALVLVDVWQWTPFMALILWSGMQALPIPPLEAAAVDGACFFGRLRLVMLPMLLPVVVVAVIFRAGEAVREFDKVFVLTGGGPGSATEVLDLYTYRTAFVNWDMSMAAAHGRGRVPGRAAGGLRLLPDRDAAEGATA